MFSRALAASAMLATATGTAVAFPLPLIPETVMIGKADPPSQLPMVPSISAPAAPLPSPALPTSPALDTSTLPSTSSCNATCDPPSGSRFWGSADYLFYLLKPAPVPVPIATTGPIPGRGVPANLVGPGQVVLGNANTNLGMFNGLRVTLGGWLNSDRDLGIEGTAFALQNKTDVSTLTGGPGKLPVLARPFFDTTIGAPNARIIALPGSFIGSVRSSSEARLWGAELNGVALLTTHEKFSLEGITGFRFISLEESFTIADRVNVLPGGFTSFDGVGVPGPAQTSSTDRFATQNHFYGGNLGLRGSYSSGAFQFAVAGKVALGDMHQVVALSGSTSVNGVAPLPATVPGGLYNLQSNIGRYTKDSFAAVPEVNFKLGYAITSHVTVTAGYNFMYLSRVVRPGDQINETLNPTLIPSSPTLGVPFGPRQPAFSMTQSDFWAHGVTVGLTARY